MVYCGKPSKGCKLCRERRIKCDLDMPACGQCTRAQKECPGYRNMLDLSFRDESSAVVEKVEAKRKKRKATPKTTGRNSNDESSTDNFRISKLEGSPAPCLSDFLEGSSLGSIPIWNLMPNANQYTPLPMTNLQPTVEEHGFNYFVSNSTTDPEGPSHSFWSFVRDLYRAGQLNDSNTLRDSITASGLAALSIATKAPALLVQARKKYSIALKGINEALRSPSKALEDATVFSILSVAIFETTVGASQLTTQGW